MRDSFAFSPLAKIKVLPPSSWRQAICHRHIAIKLFETPSEAKKSPTALAVRDFLAEDEGFEPPRTESESGVLPLH